jgi:tRNA threonylcarbamoyladenosine biosynthesis protein TsaB
MKMLALETATDRCSVALLAGGEPVAIMDDEPRVHARRILAMIEEALAIGGVTIGQLDAIAYGRGPGSFTGLRIAAGVVQGLSLGAGLPVVPVSTLAAHAVAAARVHGKTELAVCVDARMDECYWGAYRIDDMGLANAVTDDCLISPSARRLPEPGRWFGVGTGWATWPTLAGAAGSLTACDPALLPEARDLLGMAARAFDQGQTVDAAEALPVYLRDSVAWQTSPAKS